MTMFVYGMVARNTRLVFCIHCFIGRTMFIWKDYYVYVARDYVYMEGLHTIVCICFFIGKWSLVRAVGSGHGEKRLFL